MKAMVLMNLQIWDHAEEKEKEKEKHCLLLKVVNIFLSLRAD